MEILSQASKAGQQGSAHEEDEHKNTFDDIIGQSQTIIKIKKQALSTAGGKSTVLITGESGTGKGMFAKSIHYAGSRAKNAFVTVNCGAIPENLLESELFGYERGAFTGASEKGKMGKFELADAGTIFLDEIGDMPLHLQVKLLHVIQNKAFERVGGNRTICVDVRILAATNKNLEAMIRDGRFREDLYYRLSVIPLVIPPLRDREEDIFLLMKFFLEKYSSLLNKNVTSFTNEVIEVYKDYSWPGNVRELENAIEFGVNMTSCHEISREDVPLKILKKSKKLDVGMGLNLTLSEQLKIFERKIILKKLEEYGNSQKAKKQIADDLGISRATLYRKLAELGIRQ
ncbi:MAG: sigma 54-interacting transcriptional regulator [Peptostreptococcales bacterium]